MHTVVDHALPDRRLQSFVRAYIQRRTAGPFAPVAVEPYVARLGGMFDFLFASLYEIPIQGTGDYARCFSAAVVGPHTHGRVRLVIRGRIDEFVVLWHPQGLHRLFGEPAHLLVNSGLEARSLLGPSIHELHEQLGNTSDFQQRTTFADAFLLKQLPYAKPTDRVSRAIDAIITSAGGFPIAEIARHAGMSVRQLERRCLQYTGLNPKSLARISRFERALALKRQGKAQWTTIAHELEYSDQMHLIRDFRSLAGDTPGRIIRQISSHHLICMP